MPDSLPPTLSGAARMLCSAYPGGMPDSAYFAVLDLLYEHFSDRNLAELMAAIAAVGNLLARHGLHAVCAGD
ncbi:hypothetical protein [Janthinobacterium sp. P210005]|nr:hypothetical protein [Janthinobacterium sp. P210005]